MDKKHSLIVLLIFFLYLPLSLAQQISLEKAINLFENEQFQEAADMFFELDDIREDPEVFYYLGRIFSEGLGDIPVRRDVAFDYYKRATEKNHIKAQTEYAIYYLTGEFVLRDYKKAIELLEKSAKKNDILAFLLLGDIYSDGKTAKANFKKAFQNYEKAAKTGNPEAIHRLGDFYEEGKYVTKNEKKAYGWYHKAASKQFIPSLLKLAEYFRDKAIKKSLVYAYAYFNLCFFTRFYSSRKRD